MIQKIFSCDLCERTLDPCKSVGFRLKWMADLTFEFVGLTTSESASDKIVCQRCCDNIVAEVRGE